MPEYAVRFKDEAAWIGVLGSLATLTGLVLARVGADAEIVAVASGLVATVGRLIIGSLLPSPGGA